MGIQGDQLKNELRKRAISSLLNKDEITEEALDAATLETLEEINRRSVKSWAVMDFAYIRLKIYLKVSLSNEDITLYKEAKKEIDKAPYIEGDIKYPGTVGKIRDSDWY